MAKNILPGDMPNKTGTKRNGGAIPGRPAPGQKPDGKPKMPKVPGGPKGRFPGEKYKGMPFPKPKPAPKPPGTPTTPIPGNPDLPPPTDPTTPTPGPKPVKPSYRQFKNALNTPGMQPGEADALKRIQKNRGVNAKGAMRIAKRRTAKGLPTARIQPKGGA